MYMKIQTLVASGALAMLLAQASTLLAQAPPGTMAIEQDWLVELYTVSDPHRVTCPQFITGFAIPMVPALFQTTWNHRDVPDVEEGGIQLQAYSWNNLLDDREVLTPPWREKLSEQDERVTWVQRLHISDLDYVFTVRDIVGTTWGTIPGPYSVRRRFLIWAPPLELYSFEEIRRNSAVTVGSNRFKKLSVTRTRFYDINGNLLATDPVEKILFEQPQHFEHFEFRRLGDN
jgi:hypothetical protein